MNSRLAEDLVDILIDPTCPILKVCVGKQPKHCFPRLSFRPVPDTISASPTHLSIAGDALTLS